MNMFHKAVAVTGLAATFAVAALGATAVHAATPMKMHRQMRHAARLDRRATTAALNGRARKAARLSAHARRLRGKALNGH